MVYTGVELCISSCADIQFLGSTFRQLEIDVLGRLGEGKSQ